MKFLLRILLFLFILVVLAAFLALFLPKDFHSERSGVIDAPPQVAYNQVNNLKNWNKWSPWAQIDPETKWEYSSDPVGEGAWYTWTSDHKDVGKGKLTIAEATIGKTLKTEIEFEGMGTGYGTWKFEPQVDKTKVTWGFDTHVAWPFNLMMFNFDSQMGPSLEKGLTNLDKVSAEANRKMNEARERIKAKVRPPVNATPQ